VEIVRLLEQYIEMLLIMFVTC